MYLFIYVHVFKCDFVDFDNVGCQSCSTRQLLDIYYMTLVFIVCYLLLKCNLMNRVQVFVFEVFMSWCASGVAYFMF
jgi:hypothetical protein